MRDQKQIAKAEIENFLRLGVVEEGPSIISLPFSVIEKRDSTPEKPVGRITL